MIYQCKDCGNDLNKKNWSAGKQNKGWYICNNCYTDKYKKYKQNNPFKARLSYYSKRYNGTLLVEDLQIIWNSQNECCAICKDKLNIQETFCLDHIISRYNNGETDKKNIQILCEKCNVGKHFWETEEYINHCIKIANVWKNIKR